jgi:hypothetical protein
MSYDWKQLSTKIAKVGVAFLATGGIAALGGASIPAILLAALSGEAIAQGLGELAEGAVSGICPKDKGVVDRFNRTIKECIVSQLNDSGFPNKCRTAVNEEIMRRLFTPPITTLMSSMNNPQETINCVRVTIENNLPQSFLDKVNIIDFTDLLFSRIALVIDNDHEFTTLMYLQSINNAVNETRLDTKEVLITLKNLYEKLSSQDSSLEHIDKQEQTIEHGDILTGNSTKFDFGNHNKFGRLIINEGDNTDTRKEE